MLHGHFENTFWCFDTFWISRWWQLKHFWNFHPENWGRYSNLTTNAHIYSGGLKLPTSFESLLTGFGHCKPPEMVNCHVVLGEAATGCSLPNAGGGLQGETMVVEMWSMSWEYTPQDYTKVKSTWHRSHVLVYISPILTYLLGSVPCIFTLR